MVPKKTCRKFQKNDKIISDVHYTLGINTSEQSDVSYKSQDIADGHGINVANPIVTRKEDSEFCEHREFKVSVTFVFAVKLTINYSNRVTYQRNWYCTYHKHK